MTPGVLCQDMAWDPRYCFRTWPGTPVRCVRTWPGTPVRCVRTGPGTPVRCVRTWPGTHGVLFQDLARDPRCAVSGHGP